jgi:prolipoprotein diacylglyceryl transferase
VLASIPSPSFNTFDIGPLTIHVYGVFMGIAVATAYIVTVSRYERFGGERRVAERAAFWAVVIGFVGARLAYVSTHTDRIGGDWLFPIKIWEGGIALFGGLTFGTLAVLWVLRRHGGDFPMFVDAIAIGLPAAQAIGRWGNYFNQELFGTPSGLPWAVEIDRAHRPAAYADSATFHPTFLYESLWNIGLVLLLLWLERRYDWRRGRLFTVYLALYGVMRFLLELIRTDTTFRFLGLSRNGWVALGVALGGVILFWRMRGRRHGDSTGAPAGPHGDAEPSEEAAPE